MNPVNVNNNQQEQQNNDVHHDRMDVDMAYEERYATFMRRLHGVSDLSLTHTKECNFPIPFATFDIMMLPDEALGLCLFGGYLDSIQASRLALVCKKFYILSKAYISLLDLRDMTHLDRPQISSIVSKYTNLRVLDFSHCSHFGGDELSALIPVAPNLKDLRLKGTQVNDSDIEMFFMSLNPNNVVCNIEILDLTATTSEGSQLIGNAALKIISRHCPMLKYLGLGWCKNVTDKGIEELVKLTQLHTLDVSLTRAGVETLFAVANMESLVCLDMSATRLTDENIIQYSSSIISEQDGCKLEYLCLRYINDLSHNGMRRLLKRATRLRGLDLRHTALAYGMPDASSPSKEDLSLAILFRQLGIQVWGLPS